MKPTRSLYLPVGQQNDEGIRNPFITLFRVILFVVGIGVILTGILYGLSIDNDNTTNSPTVPSTSAPTTNDSIGIVELTLQPTTDTTDGPTSEPITNTPTQTPSNSPTNSPSNTPTKLPTQKPTNSPSSQPTTSPTEIPEAKIYIFAGQSNMDGWTGTSDWENVWRAALKDDPDIETKITQVNSEEGYAIPRSHIWQSQKIDETQYQYTGIREKKFTNLYARDPNVVDCRDTIAGNRDQIGSPGLNRETLARSYGYPRQGSPLLFFAERMSQQDDEERYYVFTAKGATAINGGHWDVSDLSNAIDEINNNGEDCHNPDQTTPGSLAKWLRNSYEEAYANLISQGKQPICEMFVWIQGEKDMSNQNLNYGNDELSLFNFVKNTFTGCSNVKIADVQVMGGGPGLATDSLSTEDCWRARIHQDKKNNFDNGVSTYLIDNISPYLSSTDMCSNFQCNNVLYSIRPGIFEPYTISSPVTDVLIDTCLHYTPVSQHYVGTQICQAYTGTDCGVTDTEDLDITPATVTAPPVNSPTAPLGY